MSNLDRFGPTDDNMTVTSKTMGSGFRMSDRCTELHAQDPIAPNGDEVWARATAYCELRRVPDRILVIFDMGSVLLDQ